MKEPKNMKTTTKMTSKADSPTSDAPYMTPERKMASDAAIAALNARFLVHDKAKTIQAVQKSLDEINSFKVVAGKEEALRSLAKLLANREIEKLLLEKQTAHKKYLMEAQKCLKSFKRDLGMNFSIPFRRSRKLEEAIEEGTNNMLSASLEKGPLNTDGNWFVHSSLYGYSPYTKQAKHDSNQLIKNLKSAEKAIKQAQKEFEGIKDENGKNYKDNGTIGSDIKTSKAALDKLNELKTKKTVSSGLSMVDTLLQKKSPPLNPVVPITSKEPTAIPSLSEQDTKKNKPTNTASSSELSMVQQLQKAYASSAPLVLIPKKSTPIKRSSEQDARENELYSKVTTRY